MFSLSCLWSHLSLFFSLLNAFCFRILLPLYVDLDFFRSFFRFCSCIFLADMPPHFRSRILIFFPASLMAEHPCVLNFWSLFSGQQTFARTFVCCCKKSLLFLAGIFDFDFFSCFTVQQLILEVLHYWSHQFRKISRKKYFASIYWFVPVTPFNDKYLTRIVLGHDVYFTFWEEYTISINQSIKRTKVTKRTKKFSHLVPRGLAMWIIVWFIICPEFVTHNFIHRFSPAISPQS